MGLTFDPSMPGAGYSPPGVDDELPPGGVAATSADGTALPADPGPTREIERQSRIAHDTLVGMGAMFMGAGEHEVATILSPVEIGKASIDTVTLPAWLAVNTLDEGEQFVDHVLKYVEGSMLDGFRFGPVPGFAAEARIAPPPLLSNKMQAMERGVPSIFVAGKAPWWEQVAGDIPVANATFPAHAAYTGLTQGDMHKFGGAMFDLGMTLFFLKQAHGALAPAPGLRAAPALGPLRMPREPGVNLPRTGSQLELIGKAPHEGLLAAIDDEMGGGGFNGSSRSNGRTPASPATTPLQFTRASTAEEIMQKLGWSLDELDVAIAEGNPRLAGSRYVDPVAQDAGLCRILIDLLKSEEYQEQRQFKALDSLQLNMLDALDEVRTGTRATPSEISASRQARVQAIEAVLPALQDHLAAVVEAGLNNATDMATQALARLKNYLSYFEQAAPSSE